MSAFFLFDNVEVFDPEKLADYARAVGPVVARFGGRYRSVGDAVTVVEGKWSPAYPVIIEFPDAERARAWYGSEAYARLKALRRQAAACNGVLIEGT